MTTDRDLDLLNAGSSGKTCWCKNPVGYKRPSPEANPVLACLDSEFHVWDATGRPAKVDHVYVAGPMTGYVGNDYAEFNRITRALRDAGYTVTNPAEFGASGGHYTDLLREDLLKMLDGPQAIATHGPWWESTGARNEVSVAGLLLMPVRPWQEWLEPVHVNQITQGASS